MIGCGEWFGFLAWWVCPCFLQISPKISTLHNVGRPNFVISQFAQFKRLSQGCAIEVRLEATFQKLHDHQFLRKSLKYDKQNKNILITNNSNVCQCYRFLHQHNCTNIKLNMSLKICFHCIVAINFNIRVVTIQKPVSIMYFCMINNKKKSKFQI